MNANPKTVTDENMVCDECGNFGALEIGEGKLCAECVTLAGSACAGSQNDDED